MKIRIYFNNDIECELTCENIYFNNTGHLVIQDESKNICGMFHMSEITQFNISDDKK